MYLNLVGMGEAFQLRLRVVEEISFYFARAKPNFVLKPKDKMRKEVASFKMIVNFKL